MEVTLPYIAPCERHSRRYEWPTGLTCVVPDVVGVHVITGREGHPVYLNLVGSELLRLVSGEVHLMLHRSVYPWKGN